MNSLRAAAEEPTVILENDSSEIFYKTAKAVDEKYSAVVNILKDLNGNMEKCVQKVGVVRYNPFDEVGGNLSYAVAILDSKNNGVVLNGIHSRTGSFTYAKPIELGVSEYTLSDEEQEALTKALEESYTTSNGYCFGS